MSLRSAILSLIPSSLKNRLRRRFLPWRVFRLVSPYLPTAVCIDVGASYYPHGPWRVFLDSENTHWLAVEPNKANLGYVDNWPWACQISTCTTGLSRDGGVQTLHVTNIDSGSSLLPPEISVSMKHRVRNLDYFFPVKEHEIQTLSLMQALDGMPSAPIFVKLDTQGTELSILQGATALFQERSIVGIEMESTLLATPVMKGSGRFWQACEFLESHGFELLHIKPITAVGKSGTRKPGRNTYLNECDAIFALRRDVAADLPVEYRAGLMAFYVTNLFYEEAQALLEEDHALLDMLTQYGCPVHSLIKELESAA